jgi:hypothetical protein
MRLFLGPFSVHSGSPDALFCGRRTLNPAMSSLRVPPASTSCLATACSELSIQPLRNQKQQENAEILLLARSARVTSTLHQDTCSFADSTSAAGPARTTVPLARYSVSRCLLPRRRHGSDIAFSKIGQRVVAVERRLHARQPQPRKMIDAVTAVCLQCIRCLVSALRISQQQG